MSDEGAVPAASPTLPLSPALKKTLFSPTLQKTLFSAALLEAKSQKRKLYFLPPCKNEKVSKRNFIFFHPAKIKKLEKGTLFSAALQK